MTEQVVQSVAVESLRDINDAKVAANALIDGKILLLKVGSVFSFLINPKIEGLADNFNLLKNRSDTQFMSVVCSYENVKKIVDMKRVNMDFFRLSPDLCGKIIIRVPVDNTKPLPFPHDKNKGTMQFLDFEKANPIRGEITRQLGDNGLDFISITSGNIKSAPTVCDLDSAKKLAAVFNIKAEFLGMKNTEVVVADIPDDRNAHPGSYIIVSFCNPMAVEVKRPANKTDVNFTREYLAKLFAETGFETPVEYAF